MVRVMGAGLLRRLLAHPSSRGLDVDDPATTAVRRQIIRRKPFLQDIYRDWYRALADAVPSSGEPALEIGSGAGFLSDFLPHCITSEVFPTPGVQVVLDGLALPIRDRALRAIVMTNVLHHIGSPYAFLSEAARCVRPDGVLAMIEPWVSPWSTFVYTRLHHEPFFADADPAAPLSGGPLSAANGAIPWVVFERERASFDALAPAWRIDRIRPMMPFRYVVSGGVSMRSLMPGWTTGAWRRAEAILEPRMAAWAMFALIVLRRLP